MYVCEGEEGSASGGGATGAAATAAATAATAATAAATAATAEREPSVPCQFLVRLLFRLRSNFGLFLKYKVIRKKMLPYLFLYKFGEMQKNEKCDVNVNNNNPATWLK